MDPNDPCVVAATIIDCRGTEFQRFRAFYFHSNEDADSVVDGFYITNGYADQGGGILLGNDTAPTIRNCVVTDNYAGNGGGIFVGSGGTFYNCTISYNDSWGAGGGVYGAGCTFINCIIQRNAGSAGGAFYKGPATFAGCLITGNTAVANGGGAIQCWGEGESRITNCTISGNWATGAGGGINSGNYARPRITSSIVWDNKAPTGAEISGSGYDIRYSNVKGGWPGEGNIDADPCLADSGYWGDANDPNVVVEPSDPDAVWVDGDYHLKSEGGRWDPNSDSWVLDDVTSPCIDKGVPNGCSVGAEPYPNGGRINMGAYGGTEQASKASRVTCWEALQCAGQCLGDATCDGNVNLADLYALKADFGTSAPWADNQCCADFSHDGNVNLDDLFALKTGFGTLGYSPSTLNQTCAP